MSRNIRYVKPTTHSISFSSTAKSKKPASTSDKVILFLTLIVIVVFFIFPQWIEMFKQLI